MKEGGGGRKGFLLLTQPRSQGPLRVGGCFSPYLPLTSLCLFVFFFSLAPSFRAITRTVTVARRAHLELESFVTGSPHKLWDRSYVRTIWRRTDGWGQVTSYSCLLVFFNNLILRIDLLSFSAIHNVKFAQVLQFSWLSSVATPSAFPATSLWKHERTR